MKLETTVKEFNNLSCKHQDILYDSIGIDNENYIRVSRVGLNMTIGEMIEFLGDDWYQSLINIKNWSFIEHVEVIKSEKICDTLWNDVKYKLKKY